MLVNVQPNMFVTALRGGLEYPLSPALPWQAGAVETVVVRARNFSASRMDAVGSITLAGNGHSIAPDLVAIGEGSLDGEGRFVGPTADQAAPMTAYTNPAGDLVYNVTIPWGRFVELRVQCTWGNTDACPRIAFGAEDPAAPAHRVAPVVLPAGIAPLGATPPTAPAGTP